MITMISLVSSFWWMFSWILINNWVVEYEKLYPILTLSRIFVVLCCIIFLLDHNSWVISIWIRCLYPKHISIFHWWSDILLEVNNGRRTEVVKKWKVQSLRDAETHHRIGGTGDKKKLWAEKTRPKHADITWYITTHDVIGEARELE